MSCLTPENIEAALKGEIEFVGTVKKTTVAGIEVFRSCVCGNCFGGSKVGCTYCGLEQRSHLTHCIQCGCPLKLKCQSSASIG